MNEKYANLRRILKDALDVTIALIAVPEQESPPPIDTTPLIVVAVMFSTEPEKQVLETIVISYIFSRVAIALEARYCIPNKPPAVAYKQEVPDEHALTLASFLNWGTFFCRTLTAIHDGSDRTVTSLAAVFNALEELIKTIDEFSALERRTAT